MTRSETVETHADDMRASTSSFVAWPDTLCDASPIGGKATALLWLTRAGLPVPDWFVVLPSAFDADSKTGETTSEPMDDVLVPVVARDLQSAVATLSPHGEPLAVRSSAFGEDSATLSFAGQFETRLAVRPDEVATTVLRVSRSAATARVAAYQCRVGVSGRPERVAVIVQLLIRADLSGVAFSADPVSARRGLAMVAAVSGVGEPLVSGATNADTWTVARSGEIVTATHAAGRARPVLTPEQVCRVASLARDAARLFGRPQDIEWCLAGGRLYILQSRPITTLAGIPDPDAPPAVWDCTNIAENYSGITTPLTISFAQIVYETAFRAFCSEIGVSRQRIALHDAAFRGLIGAVRGRLYYNLGHWSGILHLLPGFQWNRRFLETMLGLAERIPADEPERRATPTTIERWLDLLNLIRTGGRLARGYVTLNHRVRRSQFAIDELLTVGKAHLSTIRADELVARYRQLETRLRDHASTPTISDFWVMVTHGLVRWLVTAWIDDDPERICNDALVPAGRSISREIIDSVAELARLAAQSPRLRNALASEPYWKIMRLLPEAPGFAEALARHLAHYGDRVPGELKLETVTLGEHPLPLLRTLATTSPRTETTGSATSADPLRARLRQALRGHPCKRWLLIWLIARARARLRDREALRFTRARIFGLARRLLMELGQRLWAHDIITDTRDVLYLEVEDVLAFVEGRAVTTDLRSLIAARKTEFAGFAAIPAPPVRFSTHDIPYLRHAIDVPPDPVPTTRDTMRGIGCCPGTVTGRARIVTPQDAASIGKGDIVVTLRVDPGWVTLLPSCGGLVVEIGNPLSHGAIIARELGLPMITMVPEVTRWIRDGDMVTIDGAAGSITRHPQMTDQAHDVTDHDQ